MPFWESLAIDLFSCLVVKDVSVYTIQMDFEKLQYNNKPIIMRTKVKMHCRYKHDSSPNVKQYG